jgi:multiple sugar transport system substrate-binding protein
MRFRGFRFSVFFLSAVFFVGGLYPVLAQANPYAKYSGTTLVVNFPSHPYYEYAIKLIPEFTKETGIKVDIDKVEYMRMRDKQLLEMS